MTRIAIGALAFLVGAPALAQNFNIDVGLNVTFPVPSSSFGAAAGQAGVWNGVTGSTAAAIALVDIAGASTGATISRTGGVGAFEFDNPGTTGDDQNLMDDAYDPGTVSPSTWTISGLGAGTYRLYTYAWAPDSAGYTSSVSVAGSVDGTQFVGGTWPGGYVQGTTHALHHFVIPPGNSVAMSISVGSLFATLNGFQLVREPVGTAFCEPGVGGAIACVCGNPNGAGVGCANTGSSGASLAAIGSASVTADATDPGSLVLVGTNMLAGASCIILQGDALALGGSTTFGAGVRCAGGQLLRLFVKSIAGGTAQNGAPLDRSVSNRASDLGSPIASGNTRYYQIYYRDPGQGNPGGSCPANDTFNITTGRIVVWSP